jgi:hypothetical protein
MTKSMHQRHDVEDYYVCSQFQCKEESKTEFLVEYYVGTHRLVESIQDSNDPDMKISLDSMITMSTAIADSSASGS